MCALQFELSTEEDMPAESNHVRQEGMFHFQITHVDEQPVSKKDNSAIDGFKIEVTVLDGTAREGGVCTENKKKMDLMFYSPKLSSKDNGKWAKIKQTAFLVAAGLVDESKFGQHVTINLADALNRQIVAKLQFGKKNDQGQQYLELAWANIYHVDDPAAKDCPKDVKALALISKKLRRDPASFKSSKNGEQSQPVKEPAKAAAVNSDLGDI